MQLSSFTYVENFKAIISIQIKVNIAKINNTDAKVNIFMQNYEAKLQNKKK